MPKMWNLQPKIIFSSRIQCHPVPSWIMTRGTLKWGSKVMGLGQWGKKVKIVVWCLSWQQIKAVDSLNYLKLFKNHECLKKWSYLRKGSILGSERSNGSRKIHVGCRRTLWAPSTELSKIRICYRLSMLFQTKHVAKSKSQVTWSRQKMSRWPPWKNVEKRKIRISVTQWLIITNKHNLTINIYMFLWVENAIRLVNRCLLIIKAFKISTL